MCAVVQLLIMKNWIYQVSNLKYYGCWNIVFKVAIKSTTFCCSCWFKTFFYQVKLKSIHSISLVHSGDLKVPWLVPSRPLVSLLEARPHVSNWPPRLPARVRLLLVESRSLIATGVGVGRSPSSLFLYTLMQSFQMGPSADDANVHYILYL